MLWLVVVGYTLGSVPFAFVLARRWGHVDLRTSGSGNVGATNVFRTSGPLLGLAALMLDVAKGAATIVLAQQFATDAATPTAAGIAAVMGHVYPIWLRFRGGKGVATACGVFAMLAPLATAAVCLVFVIIVWCTRYVSLGSVVAAVLFAPVAYWRGASQNVVIGGLVAAAVIVGRHRSNLVKILAGTERRFGHQK
jgi:glycerol-3-phosphate acyltransferase PlsY